MAQTELFLVALAPVKNLFIPRKEADLQLKQAAGREEASEEECGPLISKRANEDSVNDGPSRKITITKTVMIQKKKIVPLEIRGRFAQISIRLRLRLGIHRAWEIQMQANQCWISCR